MRLRRELPFHLMLLPAVILVGIFSYGPMVGIIMAFEKFSPKKGIFGSPFVGLENFRYLMNIPDIDKVVFNTFFNRRHEAGAGRCGADVCGDSAERSASWSPFKKVIQTMVYFPHFLSWVI